MLTCETCGGEGGRTRVCDSRHLECDGETHEAWVPCTECEGTGGVMCAGCGWYDAEAVHDRDALCGRCAS